MKKFLSAPMAMMTLFLLSAAPAAAAPADFETLTLRVDGKEKKIPLFSEDLADTAIARVEDETITLGDLQESLADIHVGSSGGPTGTRQSLADIVERLVNLELIVLEARNIGLDQLPETRRAVENFAESRLREMVMTEAVKNVKADPKLADKKYREMVREWKISSLLFTKEEDAKAFVASVKAGKKFDPLMEAALKEEKAKGGKEESYFNKRNLLPQIAGEVEKTKAGALGPIVPLESGFVVFRVDDIRYPEIPEAREHALKLALSDARYEGLEKYRNALIKKYVKRNEALIKKLDFEAGEPGFEKFLEDERVLAEIQGQKAVTVADLAKAVKEKFYHGVELAAKQNKVNKAKDELLDNLLAKEVLRKEAVLKGYDRSLEYTASVEEFEKSVLFGTFIEKVVRPDLKIQVSELKEYYQGNLDEFSYPEMVRLDALVFSSMKEAQNSLERLRKGVDFKWLKANADGQTPRDTPGLLNLEENLLIKKNLPAGVQKVLTNVQTGDYRLYEEEGHYYVIYVREVIPPTHQPFEEVKDVVVKPVFERKINEALEDWTGKLKKAYDVQKFVVF